MVYSKLTENKVDKYPLKYLLFDEGLVNKTSSVFSYEYHLKDHLGNTRVTFQPSGSGTTTTQVAEYYPFGSSYLPVNPAGTNKYLYNGKEKQDDVLGSTALDWYDYGARFYDAMIGRFTTQDRFAEKYLDFSPYQYGANNPILFIDVNGDSIDVSKMSKKELKVYQGQVSAFKEKSKLFNAMYSSLERSKKVYTVQYGETSKRDDGSMVDGQFVPNKNGGGTVTFLKTNTNSQAFNEELFHAYQNDNKVNDDKGDFNLEFEAKFSAAAIVGEASDGIGYTGGMVEIQQKVYFGGYGNANMQITPANVNSTTFFQDYKSAANAYAAFNIKNNIGNRHYKVSTTVAPYSLKTMVNKAYGK